MLKKYLAIILIITAYAILLGHDIIPHHHHDNSHELIEHHQKDQHQNNDEESESLNHIFSHLIHSTDGFTFTNTHHFSPIFLKQLHSKVVFLAHNFSFEQTLPPPLLHSSLAESIMYISPHFLSSDLRAPPVFIT